MRQTTGDFIKDYRKKLQWEWFTEVNTAHFFEYCLLRANWKPGKFKGIDIPRGSFIASLSTMSAESGLTIQQIRTAIKHLESTQELTRNQHGKYTVFTVKNYCEYQDSNTISNTESTQNQHEDNTVLTRNQHGTNTEVTTIEERKNREEREEKKESNKGRKKEKKENPVYFPQDEKLNNSFLDFIQHRKAIKAPMTDIAITRAISKLQELSAVNGVMDNDLAIKIIDQSIVNGWKGLFQLQEKNQPKKQGEDWEAWFRWAEEKDKEIAERRKNDGQGSNGDNAGA